MRPTFRVRGRLHTRIEMGYSDTRLESESGGLGVQRRAFLTSLAATLISAAERLPANRNVKWAVSAGLWSHYPASPITDILDVMRDTGSSAYVSPVFPAFYKLTSHNRATRARSVEAQPQRGHHLVWWAGE